MRATSRASIPVGVMSYGRPASISASQTVSPLSQGTQIS